MSKSQSVILMTLAVTLVAGAIVAAAGSSAGLAIITALVGGAIAALAFQSLGSHYVSVVVRTRMILAIAGVLTITWNAVRPAGLLALSDVLLLGAFVVLCVEWLRGTRLPFSSAWLVAPVLLLLGAALAQGLWDYDEESMRVGITVAAAFLVVPQVIGACTFDRFGRLAIATAWVLSASFSALFSLLELAGVRELGLTLTGVQFTARAVGLTIHPNHLAVSSAMVIPVALVLATLPNARIWRVSALVGAIACLLAILASGSRAGLLAASVGIVLWLVWSGFSGRPRVFRLSVAFAGASAAAAVALHTIAPPDLQDAVTRFGASEAVYDAARLNETLAGLAHFAKSPFLGTGFSSLTYANNLAIQFLQGAGVIGLLSITWFFLGSLAAGIKVARVRTRSDGAGLFAIAVVSSQLVWVVAGFAQNLAFDQFLLLPAGFIVALVVSQPSALVAKPRPRTLAP